MTNRSPDLIERAAARLRRAPPQESEKHPTAERDSAVVLRQSSIEVDRFDRVGSDSTLGVRRETNSKPEAVNISQTSLAAQAIVLPSSGVSRTVEEFRALKREVLANVGRLRTASNHRNRVVFITSSNPGEGKTFTAINLALALAYEKETRALLIDADAYRQSVLSYLGISADKGWLDFVTGKVGYPSEVVLHTNLPNFSVMPAGKQREQIPELMSSRKMSELLDEVTLEDPARIVIMDGLPCLTSTEASVVAGLAGQTLFVIAAHETAQDQIEASLRLLSASPSVSLVLNKMHPALADHFKGYGYAYASQR
jgi:protein-tyrosine kinase